MTEAPQPAIANVPRETSPGQKYVSPFRQTQGERTRAAIVEAAWALVAEGNLRPEAKDIAARSGCHKSAITRHFGALHLLLRCMVRERPFDIGRAAGLSPAIVSDHPDIVWLLITGKRRERL